MNRTHDTENQDRNLPTAIFPASLPIDIPFASHDKKKNDNENIRKLEFLFYDVEIKMEAEI